ncbi:MAG: serine/threonine protein kinase [Ruminococcus sp.]|jgi:serine/threonine protein kinase|nr:serine/threonine protein kinase [Ruminococcus sp.]
MSKEMPPYALPLGTVLNKRFEITGFLGEGGFGITYSGFDKTLDRKVAVKEFYPHQCAFRESKDGKNVSTYTGEKGDLFRKQLSKFNREAKRTAKFNNSPGIVSVIDCFDENHTAYMVMEFLDGITLTSYLEKKGKLTETEVLELLKPVILSIRDLHEGKLIHRDIAPDNIMIVGNTSKLIDFGASADLDTAASDSSAIFVKPSYVPEEQYTADRSRQGTWTDVYALCATIYKCLTGELIPGALDRLRGNNEIPPLPPQVKNGALIIRGLALSPKDRVKKIDELIEAFYPSEVIHDPPPPKTKLIIIIIAAVIVIAVAVILIVSANRTEEIPPPQTQTTTAATSNATETTTAESTAPVTTTTAPITEAKKYDGNFSYEEYAAKYEYDKLSAENFKEYSLNQNCIINTETHFVVSECAMRKINDESAVILFQTEIFGKDFTVDLLDFVCRYETEDGETGFAEIDPQRSFDSTGEQNLAFPINADGDILVLFGFEIPSNTKTAELVFPDTDNALSAALSGTNGETIIMKTEPSVIG